MMIELNMETITEVAFVLVLSGTCLWTLMKKGENSSEQRLAWTEELHTLEGMLRELIQEATSASQTLDRRLLRRKEELQDLLGELQSREASLLKPSGKNIIRLDDEIETEQGESLESLNDFPNESWLRGKQEDPIERLLTEEQDTVTLSTALRSQSAQRGTRASSKTLSKKIEVKRALAQQRNMIPKVHTQGDPVAYKVARRLLLGGKEIHVVARKVDLPIAEIRAIDQALRRQLEKLRPSVPEGDPLDADIEREIGML